MGRIIANLKETGAIKQSVFFVCPAKPTLTEGDFSPFDGVQIVPAQSLGLT